VSPNSYNPDLPPALQGERREIETKAGRISYYTNAPPAVAEDGTPLLLVHSINAAGSSYEIRPLYNHYRASRPVYAFDLPGFGFSERSDRAYTPRLMTNAILAMIDEIRKRHASELIDALALSLSSEFLARAATETPDVLNSIAFVSPTGFDRRGPWNGPAGSTRGKPGLYRAFTFPLWSRAFYRLLTSRRSIRYFLEKTWGSKAIDEGLLDYDYLTTHQPGARHAPYYFVSGFLFSGDITRVYESLTLPVFMTHGVRGDFHDYELKSRIEGRPNWTIRVFETGALPHFEVPDEFVRAYDVFLDRARPCPA